MQMTLCFVPPGGGETDYQMVFDLPAPPRPGDYISIRVGGDDEQGTRDFIVRRTWWSLKANANEGSDKAPGKGCDLYVECEFARGYYSSESHRQSCEMYAKRGELHGKHPPVKEFDPSCY